MYRAFRTDKLVIEALETTLRHLLLRNWRAIPALRMIFSTPDELRARGERVAQQIPEFRPVLRESESPVGGGSTPDQMLRTWVIELSVAKPSEFEGRLRTAPTPVIARIERDKIILDMRTVSDEEETPLASGIRALIV